MALFEKNIGLFRKMRELASQQHSCLEEDRLDDYFQLSRQRDRLRSRITLNEKAAGHVSTGEGKGIDPAASKEEAMEMMEVIRLIQEIDAEISQTLIRKRESLASEIREMRNGRSAAKCYGRSDIRRPMFIDRKN
ncbi:MAG: hypothetical protein C4576_34695 [Desulfobacteraceae bacterium]|nr:MAG: hypothetical protein C4576_34695 [Desulfobacteraceae bacterium]